MRQGALARARTRALIWCTQRRQQIAYALGGFAASVLGTLFKLFNVALFTVVVRLDPQSFYLGHVIYALWNAVNDPAFGFLLDRMGGARLAVIRYGGPAWCASFMVTWYPWSYDGDSWLAFAHFLTAMFAFDGFLTLVMMVKCALLADLCVDSKQRNELNNFSAWFALAGSSLAMTSYYVWNPDDLTAFRVLAAALCGVSACAWYLSGKYMVMPARHEEEEGLLIEGGVEGSGRRGGGGSASSADAGAFDPEGEREVRVNGDGSRLKSKAAGVHSDDAVVGTTPLGELIAWYTFAKELLAQKYFMLYVSLNWMMNFNVYLSDSFLVFLDQLLMRHVMPAWYRVFCRERTRQSSILRFKWFYSRCNFYGKRFYRCQLVYLALNYSSNCVGKWCTRKHIYAIRP